MKLNFKDNYFAFFERIVQDKNPLNNFQFGKTQPSPIP